MRLGIDLDGVVADFNTGWIVRYNEAFDGDLTPEAVTMWDGPHQLTHFPDMEAFWEWAADFPGGSLFRHLEPYEGAVEALHKLDSIGHEVVILTTKPEWAIHDTFAWLAEHRIPTREVHITFKKWRTPCDIYLDDAPHNIRRIHRERPEALMCRFVRPWNDPVQGTQDIHTWDEFLQVVASHA